MSQKPAAKFRQGKKKSITSKKKRRRKQRSRFLKELFLALAGGSILAIGLSLAFVTLLTVHGFSMVPTLREGDKVLIRKNSELRRFDLASFTLGGGIPQVRRVIGLPGETIRYKDDTLYVNNQPVDEKFLVAAINESQKNGRNYTEDFVKKAVIIPKGYYFVLGDNRPYATDSRHYGLVAKGNVFGRVTTQIFPFNEVKSF
ncbi:signal peptidase I [Enterococcus sp. DIV0724b]|uniref:signal peptidase I n=1 Tax=Enterococcus sp. DIV0724b TaxID=2774694 RepID=UPI003D2FA70E